MNPFHLAIPVTDLAAARGFYGELLGCPEGRSSSTWVDFDLFGHQLTVHLVAETRGSKATGHVDEQRVPIPHFGVVLQRAEWDALVGQLRARDCEFLLEPMIRYVGQPAEQSTLFLNDPSGNALEFKSMTRRKEIFEA